mmetsp:Transcript_24843/g.72795  ORF Transcript_24843/g.72795 Transcript_24843/m.72795 type:complete len:212 (+) Transcript_24843:1407-2042(+)
MACALLLVHEGQHWVPRLAGPGLHQGADRPPRRFFEGCPEIRRSGILVLVAAEIDLKALEEHWTRQEGLEHADDRSSLGVRDHIEDIVDLIRVVHLHFHGMGRLEGIQRLGHVEHLLEDHPHIPLRVDLIQRNELHEPSEALVEPEIRPPVHGHEVAEPLVRQLVADCSSNGHAPVCGGAPSGVIHQQPRLPVRHTAPVLHGTGGKVGDRQ